jgi:hypothetical protein
MVKFARAERKKIKIVDRVKGRSFPVLAAMCCG